jgi:hypothetical protein
MEKGVQSQEMWAASEYWKKKEQSLLEPAEGIQPLLTP